MKTILAILLLVPVFAVTFVSQTPAPTPLDAALEKQRADRLQARYNDFANYARYRDADNKLAPPSKGENRVVFMGDSITDGWKLNEYFPGKPYINRGISGQTTSQMLLRFRPDVIALKPKVVVILAGTNDLSANTGPMTLEAIEGNIASMTELARANGINVVLSSVMPVSDYNKDKSGKAIVRTTQRPPEQILALNEWIKSFCSKRGLVYLDYFTAMVDDKGFLKADIANDGLHPNARGYEIISPLADNAIKVALKMKQPK